MDNKLKPCPFCGEDDLKIFENKERDINNNPTEQSIWFVTCRGYCFFAGPSSRKSLEDAVEKWNSRADEQTPIRVDTCPSCGCNQLLCGHPEKCTSEQ